MPSDDPPAAHQRRDPPHSYHRQQQLQPSGEALPCPRCDSNNTKFCYYNNYNLSQPRHFCKSCRRYWTQGGTLRNVPVGGNTRKSSSSSSGVASRSKSSNKRPRSSPLAASPCSSSNAISESALQAAGSGPTTGGPADAGVGGGQGSGSKTFLALGGYAPTLDGLGFGFGKAVWPFAEAGFIEGEGGSGGLFANFQGSMAVPAGNEAWNIGSGGGDGDGGGGDGGGGGSTDGEGFAWPELAISIPGQGLK